MVALFGTMAMLYDSLGLAGKLLLCGLLGPASSGSMLRF